MKYLLILCILFFSGCAAYKGPNTWASWDKCPATQAWCVTKEEKETLYVFPTRTRAPE